MYIFSGFCILLIHALIMAGAKFFKFNLFSISVASLANIGNMASTSILTVTYDKKLANIGALMAIMDYIVRTFGGLFVEIFW